MNSLLIIFLSLSSFFTGDELTTITKKNELKEKAQKALDNENYESAIKSYTLLVDSFKVDDPKIILNLAQAYYELNQLDTASIQFTIASEGYNKKVKSIAYHQLGQIELEKDTVVLLKGVYDSMKPEKISAAKRAANYYKKALIADYTNEKARLNYETIKKWIDNIPEEKKKEQEKHEEQEKQKQKEQQEKQEQEQKKKEEEQKKKEEEQKKKDQQNKEEEKEDNKGDQKEENKKGDQDDQKDQQGDKKENDQKEGKEGEKDKKDQQGEKSKEEKNGEKKDDKGKKGEEKSDEKKSNNQPGEEKENNEGQKQEEQQLSPEEKKTKEKAEQQRIIQQRLEENNFSKDKALQILNSFDQQEKKYLQQMERKGPRDNNTSDKPDW